MRTRVRARHWLTRAGGGARRHRALTGPSASHLMPEPRVGSGGSELGRFANPHHHPGDDVIPGSELGAVATPQAARVRGAFARRLCRDA
eukprot:6074686-Prymnesium_polylepis.1